MTHFPALNSHNWHSYLKFTQPHDSHSSLTFTQPHNSQSYLKFTQSHDSHSSLTFTQLTFLSQRNVKKLQFIHKLMASDTSKTAKITKRWYYPPAHRLIFNVLLSNITFLWFFAVLDVSLAVNLCINCSFLHLYLQFYYISELLQQNCLHESFVLTGLDHANQFLVFFHLNFLFDFT